ncbi:NYN domain-containing protein [Phenylobacterium sp.]|uniref:NYN domain-containing protein n=1 Tax=Phenylobacterium sp. TaxID=1871053 RepID=UPI0025D3290F|nr:NYN domain-containing protein [Phenylobacterium sp.]MCA3721350.1 NYN domain-containing protein [Phenylobacterium sp.]
MPFEGIDIRTHVYIDGFNLYYGALKNGPYKWLDVVKLSQKLIASKDTVERVKYFTARVSGAADPDAPGRQQAYLSALSTLPQVEVIFGSFMAKTAWRPLANLPVAGATVHFQPPMNLTQGNHAVSGGSLRKNAILPTGVYGQGGRQAAQPENDALVVQVHTMEEKGSDVNLGAHLLNDAWKGAFEAALVITNDTDLCVPIEMVARERNIPVYVACPKINGSLAAKLKKVATHPRHVKSHMLRDSQFPDPISPNGLAKPVGW